jgi:hypothetical protein
VRGYAAIGMPDVAAIVSSAMERLGDPYPGTTEARRPIVGYPEELMDFSDLDSQYYNLADTPQFFRKLPKFVPFADKYAGAGK